MWFLSFLCLNNTCFYQDFLFFDALIHELDNHFDQICLFLKQKYVFSRSVDQAGLTDISISKKKLFHVEQFLYSVGHSSLAVFDD